MTTNPRRMLTGYTFTLAPHLKCFVWGCYDGAVLSAQHRWLGRVQACAAHHPDRAGIAVPFGRADAVPPPASAPDAPADDPRKLAGELAAMLDQLLNGPSDDGGGDDGGDKVPRRPHPSTQPPSGTALSLF